MKMDSSLVQFTSALLLFVYTGSIMLPTQVVRAQTGSPKGRTEKSWQPPAVTKPFKGKRNERKVVSSPEFGARLTENSTVDQLRKSHGLKAGLVAKQGRNVGAAEKRDFVQALNGFVASSHRPQSERLQHLMGFLAKQPESAFSGSVWLEIGLLAERSGDWKLAMSAYQRAWTEGKGERAQMETVQQSEVALGHLANLLARTGQKERLNALLSEIQQRTPSALSIQLIAEARDALAWWASDPLANIQCGITAYNLVAESIGTPSLSKAGQSWEIDYGQAALAEGDDEEFKQHGMSLATLLGRINTAGGNFRAVKRMAGDLIPAPSIVHLTFGESTGHYSALIKQGNDSTTLMKDPHLQFDGQVENLVLNRQASGYFLMPVGNPLPAGFEEAKMADIMAVYGRASCPNGTDGEGCKKPPGQCGGMAVHDFDDFLPGLLMYDKPIPYEPSFGPALDLTISYAGLPSHTDNILSDTSNFGPHWSHALLSYIHAEDGSALPKNTNLRWIHPQGGYFRYTWSGTNFASRYPGRPVLTTLAGGSGGPGYRLTFDDGSIMDFTQANGAAPSRFYLSKVSDSQGLSLVLEYDSQLRLASITDATGGVTSFGYEGTDLKIRSITDPLSRVAIFTYTPGGLLNSITDPLEITSTFGYDASFPGRITSLTTPYGTHQYIYSGNPTSSNYNGSWSVTAIDPLGNKEKVERFYHDGRIPSLASEPRPPSSITVGSTATSFHTTTVQIDHFHTTLRWTKKQWGEYEKAKKLDPDTDPRAFARATLWLLNNTGYTTNVPIMIKEPGMAAVWYNYDGQTAGYAWRVGSNDQPCRSARLVENPVDPTNNPPVWVMTQQTYNALGNPLQYTDELGVDTRIVYFTTAYNNHATWGTTVINRDVQYEQVLSGSTWYTRRTYGKYSNRLPGTITEGSGKITTLTRNALGQVTLETVSKSTNVIKTRYTYSSSDWDSVDGQPGYLRKVERTNPTYTNHPTGNDNAAYWVTTDEYAWMGRLLGSHKDASGYEVAYEYDNFDRLTRIWHPDGTSVWLDYFRPLGRTAEDIGPSLDLGAIKDRAGRWSRTLYNALRQLVIETKPDGRTIQYEWCKCGSISKLTDELGHVTRWKRDVQGRVIEKIRPAGANNPATTVSTTFTYQPLSGRLSTIKYPNDQGSTVPTVTYTYNLDGTLKKEDFDDSKLVPGSTAKLTPDVSYTYDALGRLDKVVDGIGTHDQAYESIASGTVGAGQLASINGPFGHDTLSFNYDWQDRRNTTILATDTPTTVRYEILTWDTLGRTKTLSSTSGNTGLGTFTFNYSTNLNRVNSISGPQSLETVYEYYDNNATLNRAQRLQSLTHSRSGTQYAKHTLDYDPAGRIKSWIKEASTLPGTPVNTTNTFGYNLVDQVTQHVKKETSTSTVLSQESWAYDASGNWLSNSDSSGSTLNTRTHNDRNQLVAKGGAGKTIVEAYVNDPSTVKVNGQDVLLTNADAYAPIGAVFRKEIAVTPGTNTVTVQATDFENPPKTTTKTWQFTVPTTGQTFTYDDNGNLLSDGTRTFTWDAKNRLITVTVAGTRYRWQYDYRDRRVKEFKQVGTAAETTEKIFIWHEDEIIAERNGANSTTRTHHFGGFQEGNPTLTTSAKYLTTTDHLGNVREVIAANTAGGNVIGDVKARYDYTTFQGPEKVSGTTVDASLLTIGRYYHHAATELEFALYRAYDPVLGRWLNEDPIGERGGLNLYEYVENRPVHGVDILGLELAVVGSDDFINKVYDAINRINSAGDYARKLVNHLVCSKKIHTIVEYDGNAGATPTSFASNMYNGRGTGTEIFYNTNGSNGLTAARNGSTSSTAHPYTDLAHELGHVYDMDRGVHCSRMVGGAKRPADGPGYGTSFAFENYVRLHTLGYDFTRTSYY